MEFRLLWLDFDEFSKFQLCFFPAKKYTEIMTKGYFFYMTNNSFEKYPFYFIQRPTGLVSFFCQCSKLSNYMILEFWLCFGFTFVTASNKAMKILYKGRAENL